MSNKGDHNQDGVVNYLDDVTYLFKLLSPYILIGVGLFAKVPADTRQWVIAGGLGLAGTTGERKKTEIVMPQDNYHQSNETDWY